MPEPQPPPEEIAESVTRACPSQWWVADDYRIERGFVLPLVGGAPVKVLDVYEALRGMRTYMPMAHAELPAELAKVDGGDSAAVLAFVRRYGLLGLWKFRLDDVLGDPVAWILGHARAVHIVGDLAGVLDDEETLTQRLEALKTDDSEWPITFPLMERASAYPTLFQWKGGATPQDTAVGLIQYQLNESLHDVSRMLTLRGDGIAHLESNFVPQHLIACVYWLLADAVVGNTIRRCAECGRFFTATHDRMKYCPPPMGVEGASRCMNRAKQRKLRAAKQERARRRIPSTAPRGGTR